MTAPGFRSSGTIVQQVQQADGRSEVIAIQVNVVPVTAADAGNMELAAQVAVGALDAYETTMSKAEIIEALRYAADQLEAQQG
jgi:hypothetical protein